MTSTISCAEIDALDAAYALGALEPDDERRISEHLVACGQPHAELRELVAVAGALPESVVPLAPDASLRNRLMSAVAADSRRSAAPSPRAPSVSVATPRRARLGGWLSPRMAGVLTAAVVAALVGLTGWNVQLRAALDARSDALAEAAAALADSAAAYRVEGSAGSGYLVANDAGAASLVVTDLAALPAEQVYAMWLHSDIGVASAGSFAPPPEQGIVVADLERPIENYGRFTVTVESGRLEAPTTAPVMAADIATGAGAAVESAVARSEPNAIVAVDGVRAARR